MSRGKEAQEYCAVDLEDSSWHARWLDVKKASRPSAHPQVLFMMNWFVNLRLDTLWATATAYTDIANLLFPCAPARQAKNSPVLQAAELMPVARAAAHESAVENGRKRMADAVSAVVDELGFVARDASLEEKRRWAVKVILAGGAKQVKALKMSRAAVAAAATAACCKGVM